MASESKRAKKTYSAPQVRNVVGSRTRAYANGFEALGRTPAERAIGLREWRLRLDNANNNTGDTFVRNDERIARAANNMRRMVR